MGRPDRVEKLQAFSEWLVARPRPVDRLGESISILEGESCPSAEGTGEGVGGVANESDIASMYHAFEPGAREQCELLGISLGGETQDLADRQTEVIVLIQ